jgi:hypothetical protein
MNPYSKETFLARSSEPSEPANAVPPPELNPLQNPLLAENMNRWAEVYFTNPPERRDAAVVELLQELVQEKQRREEQQRRPVVMPFARSRDLGAMSRDHSEEVVYCRSCRTENPASHQFCGNCGQKLSGPDSEGQRAGTTPVQQEHTNVVPQAVETAPEPIYEGFHEDAASDERQEFVEEPMEQEQDSAPYTPPFSNSDLSLFQSLRVAHDVEEEDWEYGPQRSSSYRYYIAAVLAILIVGLGYLAWRGAQSAQGGNGASAAPPTPAAENVQPPATPATGTEKSESASPAATQPAPAKSAAQPTNSAETPSKNDAASEEVVKASETQHLAAKTAPPATASSGNGAEELAMAQSYLNGTSGHDGSEAAKWLWKSVSKHNGQATLALADLYLRGDGVPKNCEQGRILLDSAAQRGIRGAGERLRNLQAFGCH